VVSSYRRRRRRKHHQKSRRTIFLACTAAIVLAGAGIVACTRLQSPRPQETAQSRDDFCLGGCPIGGSPTNRVVKHHILELSNNTETKFADWVAYRISMTTLGSHCQRTWQRDPALPENETLSPADFSSVRRALRADRGHQAPLASLCGSQYWQEADYLSNITPQQTDLNEGAWEALEKAERGLVYSNFTDDVYSITGPLYERPMGQLPNSHLPHHVPSGYWKIVSVVKSGQISSVGFLMEQDTPPHTNFCRTLTSIKKIEARSHFRYFPLVSDYSPNASQTQNAALLRALHC
jgi:endonuclease G